MAIDSTANSPALAGKQRALLDNLTRLPDPQERLGWLVEQARRRPLMEAALRTDEHRVEGCLARLWLVTEFRDGHCHYRCESDSLVVKAIAGLLCEFYSGHAPGEILAHDPAFLAELGVTQHLTPNRRNGLALVWGKIRAFAQNQLPPFSAPEIPAARA